MSLIYGCWLYGKRSPDDSDESGLKLFEDYKKNSLIEGSLKFGHIAVPNTNNTTPQRYPTHLTEDGLFFTAQGRIDNAETLSQQWRQPRNAETADGSFILNAYLKWGKECVTKLRGDWSFAAFDFKKNELFLARDQMGYTAIYYYQDQTGFYFSSSIKYILQLPCYKKAVNEEYFVQSLTLWDYFTESSNHLTLYNNIYVLPLAHSLTVTDKNIKIEKYWHPENIKHRYYKRRQDYADEMLELFTQAVQYRLKGYPRVAGMLSGGLDSSAVCFVAAGLLKRENKVFTTFSHVPLFSKQLEIDSIAKRSIPDETPNILAVAKAAGNINPIFLKSANYPIVKGIQDTILICNNAFHAAGNFFWVLDLYKTAVQNGFKVLLSGEGGNGSISFEGLDYLLPFNFTSLIHNPYLFARKQIAKPLAVKFISHWIERRTKASSGMQEYAKGVLLRSEHLERFGVLEDIQRNKKGFNTTYKHINDLKNWFARQYNKRSLAGASFGQYLGLELRDPTTDVDLMEFFFSLPTEAFFDDHYNNRMLVKRMMNGKIPDQVLFEKKRGLQSGDLAYRAKAQAPEITAAIENVKTSQAASHYIDTKKLSETWQQYLQRSNTDPYEMQRILKALNFAMFLQMNFD
mgnify:CR=1 FL=1